jgi:Ca-activated chloride channel homolog
VDRPGGGPDAPQWLTPYTEVSTPGYDLMLAVDASHSMDALDFTVEGRQVTRMQVVKGVMGRFIDSREGDRIGLIIFGSQAFVLSPLTVDRNAVRQLLDGVVRASPARARRWATPSRWASRSCGSGPRGPGSWS